MATTADIKPFQAKSDKALQVRIPPNNVILTVFVPKSNIGDFLTQRLQYVLFRKENAPRFITAENARSWAHASVVERLPAILQKVCAPQTIPTAFAGSSTQSLSHQYSGLISPEFVNQITSALRENGTLPLIKGGPHKERYNAIIDGIHTHHFPWLALEAVFYRLVMDECNYWEKGLDPFRPQKLQSLVESEAVIRHIETARSQFDHPSPETVANLLNFSLWSNAADLSRHPEGVDSSLASNVFSTSSSESKDNVLVNDSGQIISLIRGIPVQLPSTSPPKRIIVITDNAGVEFISDLLWADVMISSNRIQIVEFHVKLHPTFVSDVTLADVEDTLVFIEKVAPTLGKRWRGYFKSGIFVARDHFYYNAYEPYWIVPLDLYHDYQKAEFVISKGDANARRFHGDRMWDFTTPTNEIVSYFPVPLLLVRTFKSETVSGVTPGTIHELVRGMKSDWYHSGQYGSIQLVLPQLDLRSPQPARKGATSSLVGNAIAATARAMAADTASSASNASETPSNQLQSPSSSYTRSDALSSTEESELVDVNPASPSPIVAHHPHHAHHAHSSLTHETSKFTGPARHQAPLEMLRSASEGPNAGPHPSHLLGLDESDVDPLELVIRELMHDDDHDGHHAHNRSYKSRSFTHSSDDDHASQTASHHRHHHHHHRHHDHESDRNSGSQSHRKRHSTSSEEDQAHKSHSRHHKS